MFFMVPKVAEPLKFDCNRISMVVAFCFLFSINPIALRTAKTLWSFGRSECNRVNALILVQIQKPVKLPQQIFLFRLLSSLNKRTECTDYMCMCH